MLSFRRVAAVVLTAASLSSALSILTPTLAGAASGYAPPTARQLAALRGCEASGNYRANTGNGYYGAYQFDQRTWSSLGLPGRPDHASPAMQDAATSRVEQSRGWSPWPSCSQRLGLSTSQSIGHVTSPAASYQPPTPTRVVHPRAVHVKAAQLARTKAAQEAINPLGFNPSQSVAFDWLQIPSIWSWYRAYIAEITGEACVPTFLGQCTLDGSTSTRSASPAGPIRGADLRN